MRIHDVVFVFELSGDALVRHHSRRHTHGAREFELHYFLGGNGSFRNGRDRYAVRRGGLFLSIPGEEHEIYPASEPITYYAVLFDADDDPLLRDALLDPGFRSGFPRQLGVRERGFFEALKNDFSRPDPLVRRSSDHRLAAFLLDMAAGDEPAQRRSRSTYDLHVERAIEIFQHSVFEPKTLRDVCRELEITEEHLIRLFRKTLGITPMRYYRNLKMEAAVSMLVSTTLSVKEISWKLSFASPYHFSRRFKAFTGLSPTTYRANGTAPAVPFVAAHSEG
jgi:AraC-like DNA-binding protein